MEMKVFIGGHRVLRILRPFSVGSEIIVVVLDILVRFVVGCNRRV